MRQDMGPIKHKALINVDLGEGYGNLKCVAHYLLGITIAC